MKNFWLAFGVSFLSVPFAFAMSTTTGTVTDEYRIPEFGVIEFNARYDDGAVHMKWTPFPGRNDEKFLYYKVLSAIGNDNPVYPEDPAMAYMDRLEETDFVHYQPERSAYYRVCAITDQRGRYCSNVLWVEVPKEPATGSVGTEDPNMMCPEIYEPVCGFKPGYEHPYTFPNECELERHDGEFLEMGVCREEDNDGTHECRDYASDGTCEDGTYEGDSQNQDEDRYENEDAFHEDTSQDDTDWRREEAYQQMMRRKAEQKRKAMMEREKREAKEDTAHDRPKMTEEDIIEKVKPKLERFLDRLAERLENSKASNEAKIAAIKRIQERLYKWGNDNRVKMVIVDYLDEHLTSWIEELQDDVGDIDSFLEGLLQE